MATEEKPKKKTTSRAEAGLVEEDFEQQPNDEAIANQEHLPEEVLEDPSSAVLLPTPSNVKVPGMSEEEQEMEMTPTIVGPPAYGSPDPVTSAGRLLPLDQHPFNPENLPDDHPAAIDASYGEGYEGNISPDQIGTQFPGTSGRSDLENALQGQSAAQRGEAEGGEEANYEEQTKADLLAEAESRGLDVNTSNTKAEIVTALEEDDATS